MPRSSSFVLCFAIVALPTLVVATNPPAATQQAVALAAQSISALTGGSMINDVTLTGRQLGLLDRIRRQEQRLSWRREAARA